jgi:hypothetical protein
MGNAHVTTDGGYELLPYTCKSFELDHDVLVKLMHTLDQRPDVPSRE